MTDKKPMNRRLKFNCFIDLNLYLFLSILFIATSSQAMRLEVERCELPLPKREYLTSQFGDRTETSQQIARDSLTDRERTDEFKEECKSKCGGNFEFDSIVERQEVQSASYLIVELLGFSKIRIIVHRTLECVKESN